LEVGICPLGESVRRNSFGNVLEQRRIHNPWGYHVDANTLLRYSIARLLEIALIPPLVIIGTMQ